MEWLTAIRTAIGYMEGHLGEAVGLEDVAREVHLSPFFLQRGFSLMTGYGIGEYLRNRRLYEAALDLQRGPEKVIDIAFKYGYETPESFAKAFARFHGATPTQVREGAPTRTFLPLTIQITIQGGNQMDCKITPMFPFKVIGFQKEFDYETAYAEIPRFWDEICEKYANNVYAGNDPANPYEQALVDNCIGEYGVCIDDLGGGRFRYLIAGKYTGGPVPEGMVLYEFPRGEWAVFDCVGPNPQTLQSVNTRIFREWLPGNPDYHSAIWVPVKRKV